MCRFLVRLSVVGAVALTTIVPSIASASAIVLSVDRRISGDIFLFNLGGSVIADQSFDEQGPMLGNWIASENIVAPPVQGGTSVRAFASQESFVSDSAFSASGESFAITSPFLIENGFGGGAAALSLFQVDFLLTAPHAFTWSSQAGGGLTFANLLRLDLSEVLIGTVNTSLSQDGTLDPGQYRILARSEIPGGAFDLSMTLTEVPAAVPEPSSLLLFSVGVGVIAGRRRQRP